MEWLSKRLTQLGHKGKSGAGLARALKIPKQRVYEMKKGDREFQQDEITPAARYLEWSESELLAHIEGRSRNAIQYTQIGEKVPEGETDNGHPFVVLYRTVRGDQCGWGGFMLYAEETGAVYRPYFLRFSKKAFAIQILDSSYTRMYRKRDTLLIDPDDDLTEGEDCLFTDDFLEKSGVKAVIACLIRSTGTSWIVTQTDPTVELELPKSEFKHAWPIVGVHRRRR
jgi:phage repressor protein C with HTH and peptisase S24 domain